MVYNPSYSWYPTRPSHGFQPSFSWYPTRPTQSSLNPIRPTYSIQSVLLIVFVSNPFTHGIQPVQLILSNLSSSWYLNRPIPSNPTRHTKSNITNPTPSTSTRPSLVNPTRPTNSSTTHPTSNKPIRPTPSNLTRSISWYQIYPLVLYPLVLSPCIKYILESYI